MFGDVFWYNKYNKYNKYNIKGLLVQKELKYFCRPLYNPNRPYLAIIGGKKISDKIQVIDNLINVGGVNELIITGTISHLFLFGAFILFNLQAF